MKPIYFLVVILLSPSIFADKKLCMYPDSSTLELEQFMNCGDIKDGLLTLDTSLMKKVRWSKYGMQCIYVNYPDHEGWFYINQNGLGRGTPFTQDNDCRQFQSGLAVGVSNGHVVYFNQTMDVVKATKYTWASSFYKGYSKVCKGRLTKEYDNYGELYELKGGQCGFINRAFKVVVPIQYRYEFTPKPTMP